MKMLLSFVLLLGWGGIAPTAALAAPADRHAECPDRREHEDGRDYGARVRDYCEVRWRRLLAVRQTGGQTHDELIDGCLRRCIPTREAGTPLGWGLGSVAGDVLISALVSLGGSDPPPASP
jgi:hypothetical protein